MSKQLVYTVRIVLGRFKMDRSYLLKNTGISIASFAILFPYLAGSEDLNELKYLLFAGS
jgi:hypothetical protein